MIKILIADDHELFLDGIQSILKENPDIEIAGKALNGQQVIDILENNDIDIAVLDIEMPELDGIETTRYIKKHFPKTKVLIVSNYNQKSFLINLMKVGFDGYILKNKTAGEYITAIKNVYDGKRHISLEVMDTIFALPSTPPDEEQVQLTEREMEIAKLLALGYTSKQISAKLFISDKTVDTHRRNILRKLDLANIQQLVRHAIRNEWIEA